MNVLQSIDNINAASNISEFFEIVEYEVSTFNCEIDVESNLEEARDWFAQEDENGDERLVAILDAAIAKRDSF